MDSIRCSLEDARGGKALRSQPKEAALSQPTSEHRETQRTLTSGTPNNTTKRTALPTGSPAPTHEVEATAAAANKPAYTRGISVFDQTACTSAAPTPAGEISNPMSFGMGQSISRQRESHLPDLDLVEKIRSMSTTQKVQVADEEDDFGPDLSRQETEKGR